MMLGIPSQTSAIDRTSLKCRRSRGGGAATATAREGRTAAGDADSPGLLHRFTDHSPIEGFENAAHLARQRLDLLQARDGLAIVLVRPQEEQLGLGQDGGEGVGEVVPELADRVRGVGHLEQRPIQIAQVMVAQVADGLPQIRLRRGAEDLGRRALRLGVRRPEQDPAPPHAVVAAAYLETNGDELSVEANGGEVVDDRVARVRCVKACRLCRHAAPRAGLCKDKRGRRLRNTRTVEVVKVVKVVEVLEVVSRLNTTSTTSRTSTTCLRFGTGSVRTWPERAPAPPTPTSGVTLAAAALCRARGDGRGARATTPARARSTRTTPTTNVPTG